MVLTILMFKNNNNNNFNFILQTGWYYHTSQLSGIYFLQIFRYKRTHSIYYGDDE